MLVMDSQKATTAARRQQDCELSSYFKSYEKPLIRLAMSRGCSRETAEDICQEVFMRMQKMIGTQSFTSVQAYLSKIAINLIHEHRRKDLKVATLSRFGDWDEELFLNIPDLGSQRQRQGMIAIEVCRDSGKGTTGHFEFRMFYEDDMDSSAIAKLLKTNATTVRSRIQRFIAKHKKDIEQALDQDFHGVMLSHI